MDFPLKNDEFDYSSEGPLGMPNREHRPSAARLVYDAYLYEAKRRVMVQKLIGRADSEKNWVHIYNWVDTIGGCLR